MMINGIAIATHWDFERSVHDGRGREALGVTEADPALPDIVLISLNAKLIAEREYLKRSTLAHEFGHAVFDGCGCEGTSARSGRGPWAATAGICRPWPG